MEGVPEASGTLIDFNESNLLIIFLNTIISKENNRYHILILSSNKYYVIPYYVIPYYVIPRLDT